MQDATRAYDTYNNDVVIINTYPFDVKVRIFENTTINFKPFEIKTIKTVVNDNLKLNVHNSETNELLRTIRTGEVVNSSILTIIVLNNFGREICYFTGDVEPFYYKRSENTAVRYRFQKRNFINTSEYKTFAHPGNALIGNFPNERVSKRITGFFPIDCEFINNAKKLSETIELYQTYESGVQKQIYDLLKADVGTVELEDLRLNYYLNL